MAKKQIIVHHKGESYTFHTRDGMYSSGQPYASVRNNNLLREVGMDRGTVDISKLKAKLNG